MCPKHLGIRGRELVGSLIDFFEKERDAGGPFIRLTCVRERVAVALNVNIATVSIILQSLKKHEVVQPVAKSHVHMKPITYVENFCQDAIRNLVYRMYENCDRVTVQILWEKLKTIKSTKVDGKRFVRNNVHGILYYNFCHWIYCCSCWK